MTAAATWSPEAVTRLQLPPIVACGCPARRSADEASPHRLRLQPWIGQAERRTLERRGAREGSAHRPPPLGRLAAATEPLAPVALDAAVDAPQATAVAHEARGGRVASQDVVDGRGWLVERFVPNPLPPLRECRQTAPPSSLVSAPSPLEVATAVARAGQGQAQTCARLPAGPWPRGLVFGHAPERPQAGVTRLERHSERGQALDQPLVAAGRVRLRRDPHDAIIAIAPQVGCAWQPWLHHPLAPPVQPVVQVEVAQDDAALPPVRDPCVAGLDAAVCPPAGVQPPPDQAHEAWVSDAVWHHAPEPARREAPEAMAPVGLGDPAPWLPRDDLVACRPCLVRPPARSATHGARQTIRRVEGRQHVSHAPAVAGRLGWAPRAAWLHSRPRQPASRRPRSGPHGPAPSGAARGRGAATAARPREEAPNGSRGAWALAERSRRSCRVLCA
jgi:hypothetical protein